MGDLYRFYADPAATDCAEQPTHSHHKDTGWCLLYIGISSNAYNRFKQHRADKDWLPNEVLMLVQYLDCDRDALAQIEIAAIQSETPVFNVMHNSNSEARRRRSSQRSGHLSPTTQQCILWLAEFLADGPKSAREIDQQANQIGFSAHAMRAAKNRVAQCRQSLDGWVWALKTIGFPDDCPTWLAEFLADGPKSAKTIEQHAIQLGFSAHAVRVAKKRVAQCRREVDGWVWALKTHQSPPNDCQTWLAEFLADGPKSAKTIEQHANKIGFTASGLRSAKKRVAQCRQTGDGWVWALKTHQFARKAA